MINLTSIIERGLYNKEVPSFLFVLNFNITSYFQLKKLFYLISDRFSNDAGKSGSLH